MNPPARLVMTKTRRSVIVIGDVMLDRRIEGDMTRIAPESPSPILKVRSAADAPGAAANVAMNIAAMGHPVQLVGLVGDDPQGQALRAGLRTMPDVLDRLVSLPQAATIVKGRLTCDGQQVFRIDEERPLPVDSAGPLLTALAGAGEAYEPVLVVVSDYGKGTMSAPVRAAVMELCSAKGLPLFVDAKPFELTQYHGATLLTPNLAEAKEAAALCVHPALASDDWFETAAASADYLLRYLAPQHIVVTCGSHGAVLHNASLPRPQHFSTKPCQVFDVTGAGDTFMAAMAVGCVEGWSLEQAIHRANIAARVSVQRHGVVAVSRDDWEDERHVLDGYAAKHMSNTEFVEFARRARRQGKRVVFTNGTFDLLHPGHIYLLAMAREEGDVLMVAYNSDASVRRYKGPDRPLIPEDWRGVTLTTNAYVSAVTRFAEDDPTALIQQVQPDVLIKGEEYVEAHVPGADYVASRGGRVHFVPMFRGFSTTAIKTQLQQPDAP